MTAILPAPSGAHPTSPSPLGRDWLVLHSARLTVDPEPAPTLRIDEILGTSALAPASAARWRHLPAPYRANVVSSGSVGPRSAAADRTPRRGVRLSELLVRQSRALDAAAGRRPGHAVRTAFVAVRLAEVLGRNDATRRDVIHAALLKDLGGLPELTTLARLLSDSPVEVARDRVPHARDLRGFVRLVHEASAHLPIPQRAVRLARLVHVHTDWRRRLGDVRYRRGAGLAARIGFSRSVSDAIAAGGERWDGRGSPLGLSGIAIPETARIVAVAAAADEMLSRLGAAGAQRGLRMRAGGPLDPTIARLAADLGRLGLWRELESEDLVSRLLALEPDGPVRYGEPHVARRLVNATRRIARMAERAGVDLAFHGVQLHGDRGLAGA